MKTVSLSKATRWHKPEHHISSLHNALQVQHTDNIASDDSSCLGACAQSREAAINFMPVRLRGSHWTDLVKFDYQAFYGNMAIKSKFG